MKFLAAGTNLGPLEGLGTLGKFGSDPLVRGGAFSVFTNTISTAIGILTVSAGIWFIFQIFIGAFQWLSSGGEKQGIENARKRITNAIIGLFVVVASYALISLVGMVFGINILSPFSWLGLNILPNSAFDFLNSVNCDPTIPGGC